MPSPNAAANTHILILDEVLTPTISNHISYTSFLLPDDNVSILIITSKNALTAVDKERCLDYVELDVPTTNGRLELHALRFHEKYRIDKIYTKQEDLILRAAYLRQLLGIRNGLSPDAARVFRDKEVMKRTLREAGFPVPDFARIWSPSDILAFTRVHSFPVIVKPILGSASAGIRIIKSQPDLERFLEHEFYEGIDGAKRMDYAGDMMIEEFVDGKMYHVNGYAKNGKLEKVWPFMYLKTNLGFTMGEAYGNVSIPPTDQKYNDLLETTNRVLDALPKVDDLVFHLELFARSGKGGAQEYVLCEIAARRPGGSIGVLINTIEGGDSTKHIFSGLEFRLSNGLAPPPTSSSRPPTYTIGDLLIPRQIGTLTKMPEAECPVSNVTYLPFAKVGSIYKGFDVGVMNTCARFIAIGNAVTEVGDLLRRAQEWFEDGVQYEKDSASRKQSIDSPPK